MTQKTLNVFVIPINAPETELSDTGTSKTTDEKSMVNKAIDTDGFSTGQPYQCVDFIVKYYEFLGVTLPGGNGKDYATNKLPSGWQRIKGVQSVKGYTIDKVVLTRHLAKWNDYAALPRQP